MGEKSVPCYQLQQFSARQLSESLHVRTSAGLGGEDGRADPVTPNWEAAPHIPTVEIGKELLSRLSNGISPLERSGVIADLSQARGMLERDNAYLTDEQKTDKRRLDVLIGYEPSRKSGDGERLSIPPASQIIVDSPHFGKRTGRVLK